MGGLLYTGLTQAHMSQILSEHIKKIIQAKRENRLTIFVGSGVSKSSNTASTNYPSWEKVIEELKNELGLERAKEGKENYNSDFLKIAQLYYLQFQEIAYRSKIKSLIPTSGNPSEIHKLIFDIQPNYVITTNWDTLLEDCINIYAYVYDIVKSDRDLVSSLLPKKLIKMHGDLDSPNFVFKEDDYLNYSDTFPLIENFIKSILSTNVVLFIGYSYSDITLKNILNWLKKKSVLRPAMYLTLCYEDDSQRKYLENHGITSLNLDFFKEVNCTQRLHTLLKTIKDEPPIQKEKSVNQTELQRLYELISPLEIYKGILKEQLTGCFKSSVIEYDNEGKGFIGFNFKDEIDVLKLIAEIKDRKEVILLKKIANILFKADVYGFTNLYDSEDSTNKIEILDYVSPEEINLLERILNFEYLISSNSNSLDDKLYHAFSLFQIKELEKCLKVFDEIISSCLKERNYYFLFIALFNKNSVLHELRMNPQYRSALEKDKTLNIHERLKYLPIEIQTPLNPIKDFLEFRILNYKITESILTLKKKEESIDIISKGGFSFERNADEPKGDNFNILGFVLRNYLLFDNYQEIEQLSILYFKITATRQALNQNILVNKHELYCLIRFVRPRELNKLLESSLNPKNKKLTITEENQKWLINILKQLQKTTEEHNQNTRTGRYLENTLSIFVELDIKPEVFNTLLETLFLFIQKGFYPKIYPLIALIAIRNKIMVEGDLILKLKEFLNKSLLIILKQDERTSRITYIETNRLVCYTLNLFRAKFTDSLILDLLFTQLENLKNNNYLSYVNDTLFNIYDIGDRQIRRRIKEYFKKINFEKEDIDDKLIFLLMIKIYKLESIIDNHEHQLKKYLNFICDSDSYTSQEDYILSLLRKLRNKDFETFIKKLTERASTHSFGSLFNRV